MHDQYQLPPPSSWEKFESLCKDIFAIEWGDSNTKRHGRSGFPQHGVDVYGYSQDGSLHGIQCKKKDVAVTNKTAEKELRDEVAKALNFTPKLSSFVFATTTPNDPNLEEVARLITSEHKENNLFSVRFLGWNDILDKLSSHDHLLKKYYSWALPSDDPNNYAFGLWQERFSCLYLFENACVLPFRSHQVTFRPRFIIDLCSFINQSDVLLDEQRTRDLDRTLRHSLNNFKMVSSDLIDNAVVDGSRTDANHSIYMYWVNKGNLPYHQQRDYVEYKKKILLYLFFNLICAANHIIDVKNKLSKKLTPQHDFVKFQDSFESPMESQWIPMYSAECVSNGILYEGIHQIKQMASHGLHDPVLEYEKKIEAEINNSSNDHRMM